MKRFAVFAGAGILFALILATLLPGAARGDSPRLINFQGMLRDGSGNPVSDGFYTVRFRIYDDSTAGSVLWEETVPVQTIGGLFNVRLGDAVRLPQDLFATGVNRFVGVKVNVDAELAPRTRLISTPYSLQSLRSDSAAAAAIALDLTCAGCVDAADINDAEVQRRVTGMAPIGEYITGINQDGSVVTAFDLVGESGWTDDGATVRLTGDADNVGIGTLSPQFGARLEVADRVNVTGAGTSRVFIGKDGDEYLEAGYDAVAGKGFLSTGGSQALSLQQTGGNVGIGTTFPQATLHVYRASYPSLMLSDASGTTWSFTHDGTNLNMNAGGATRTRFLPDGEVHFGIGGGEVGIGTESPVALLHIATSSATAAIRLDASGTPDWSISNDGGTLYLADVDEFGGTSRLIINSDGTTTLAPVGGNVGIGTYPSTRLHVSASGADVATFNRNTNDGTVIRINQAGITEGTISVAGTTVSYNAFTGSHYGWTDEALERGELVTLTGTNLFSHDNPNSEILYGIKRSAVPNDPACLGSYLGLQNPALPYGPDNPHLIMAVGNGDMWVVDEGGDIRPGDYLISSSTAGHAMKDDEAKYPAGHIVARAAEAVDWAGVGESINGHRHKRISVLFGNFGRSGDASLQQLVRSQQQQIERLEEDLKEIQGRLPQAKL